MSNTVLMTQMSLDDLKALIAEAVRAAVKADIKQEFKDAIKDIAPKQDASKDKGKEKFLTREEAAEYLNISVASIDRYRKVGTLKYHRIGGKVLLEKNELQNSLQAIHLEKNTNDNDRIFSKAKRIPRGHNVKQNA